jgi:hypothetical protein
MTYAATHRMILETKPSDADTASRWGCRALKMARVGLLAMLIVAGAAHAAIGYSVRSDGDKKLYRINLSTGVATALGDTGFSKIEALAMSPAGEVFGVNPATSQLVKCSTTAGTCAGIGTLSGVPPAQTNVGLTFDASGKLFMSLSAVFYAVNPVNAMSTALGPTGAALSGLANGKVTTGCASGVYAVGGNSDQGKLYCMNTTTGAASEIGSAPNVTSLDGGLDGDLATGLVWGITNANPAQIYSINPSVSPLAAINVKTVTVGGQNAGGFESLAVNASVLRGASADAEVPTLGVGAGALLVGLLICCAGLSSRRSRQLFKA